MIENQRNILVIYTGGTIGMFQDPDTQSLRPVDFNELSDYIPSLDLFDFNIDAHSFEPIIDSANMQPEFWTRLAKLIQERYESYDGFVILHGSDTMSYTASALSFMLQNLNKAVVLTGSQLPLGMPRTDGRENFITALEIAAAQDEEGTPLVPEVSIYFENHLFRGNRTYKFNAENFEAFRSVNYPALAHIGINIKYHHNYIHKPNFKRLRIREQLCDAVTIIRLFPGLNKEVLQAMLGAKGLQAAVLETYGAGNAPTEKWFVDSLKEALERGIAIVNISQCRGGSVEMGKYETGAALRKIGLIDGKDMTVEAAVTKLMVCLPLAKNIQDVKQMMESSWSGEISH